jgi:chitin disaccharide deacetylase
MSGRTMRSLILNADDYAMDEAVDEAILTLASRGVVTAASAMVLSPRWREAANNAIGLNVDCGLHLDLSSDFALKRFDLPRLPTLIARSYAGGLGADAIRDAIEAQLDLFETEMSRQPDFVDGHQHVHQLPAVRLPLLRSLARRYGEGASAVGIRVCEPRRWRGAKAHLIGRLGGRKLARLAHAQGHTTSSDFLGVYGFSHKAELPALWRRWLKHLAGDTPLAMCHVAVTGDEDGSDPIRRARINELAWLGSGAFQELCAERGIALSRWPRAPS